MTHSPLRVLALGAALLLPLSLAPPVPAQEESTYRRGDRSITAYNVLPPGQGRYMNGVELLRAQTEGTQPEQNFNQIEMYEAMVRAAPNVTAGQLGELFKDASFGVRPEDVAREYSPRDGVTIIRDASYGVPHVYGESREDTFFGAGYVSGEDRLFMMDVLRHLGRGRVSEFLGASEANLALDRAQRLGADYSEEDLVAIAERVLDLDPELGAQFRDDATAFADGVNAFIQEARLDPTKLPGEYPALQVLPADWKLTDSVAIASLIGASLGVGGGQELENAAFLDALRSEGYSAAQARAIYDDFRFLDDPEAPTTVEQSFPWLSNLPPADPDTIALPDDPQAVLEQADAARGADHADGPFGPIPLRFPEAASNALLVGANLSKSGRPLAVFGPQVGYWSPEILMEIDLHGPGVHARGAAFPGLSVYVLLGRGKDYAWSATSAGGDQVDIFAVELCEPEGGEASVESPGYVRDGECVALLDTGISYVAKPSAAGFDGGQQVLVEIPTERTEEGGIVQARGTAGGTPAAFVRHRASYGAEVDSGLAYVEMMDPGRIKGAQDFQRAFRRFAFTFNWFYVDDRDIAYQLGGYHPVRPAGVDPSLPIWSRPDTRWTGMLSAGATPKAISPATGFLTSWNNKQAPGFGASDGQWSYGPVHRSQPLDDRILAAKKGDGKVGLVELVNAMGDAGTVDLRGDKVLPLMLDVLGNQGDPQLADAIQKLRAWHASGAHRRDRDGDGRYEHREAVEIMDAWWDPALERAFGPVLREAFDDVPLTHDDGNRTGHIGSAFQNGWYGQLHKDLRTVLGRPVQGRFANRYCGFGDLASCREALRVSLVDALEDLGDGGQPPPEERDEIRFAALGVQGQRAMHWQNRPTFQQVVEFGDLCPGHESRRGIHHVGTGGADLIVGTPFRDVICGLGGADDLRGGSGNDLLLGGPGNDVLRGGAGTDRCLGGSGSNSFKSCERRN